MMKKLDATQASPFRECELAGSQKKEDGNAYEKWMNRK